MGQTYRVEEVATENFDLEIIDDADGFEVWTPDVTGSMVGHGKTRAEALAHAISSMETLVVELKAFAAAPPVTACGDCGDVCPVATTYQCDTCRGVTVCTNCKHDHESNHGVSGVEFT